jgi:hypothetical protein
MDGKEIHGINVVKLLDKIFEMLRSKNNFILNSSLALRLCNDITNIYRESNRPEAQFCSSRHAVRPVTLFS